jgi:prepilin-type N-terminal cleavage/methylation domain-containing protein
MTLGHFVPRRGHRAFTLIELLVVIAIIGILSSVVLASLNTARTKGNDAAIKSNLDTIRTQAELYYDNNTNTYGSAFTTATCPTSGTTMFYADTTIRQAIASAESANGASVVTCGATTSAYAVSSPLSTSGQYWCVDSTGASKQTTAVLTGTVCP